MKMMLSLADRFLISSCSKLEIRIIKETSNLVKSPLTLNGGGESPEHQRVVFYRLNKSKELVFLLFFLSI